MLQDQRAGHIQRPALPALDEGAATPSAAAVADQRASLGERVAHIEEEIVDLADEHSRMLQDQRAGHIQLPALPVDATATPRAADWPTVLEFGSPGQADPALAAGAATASAAAVADQRASLGERVAHIEEEMANLEEVAHMRLHDHDAPLTIWQRAWERALIAYPRRLARIASSPELIDRYCPRILETNDHALPGTILQIRPRWQLRERGRILLAAPSRALSVDRVRLAVALVASAYVYARIQPYQIVIYRCDPHGANCCALPLEETLFVSDWVEAELRPGPPSHPPPQP